MAILIEDAGGEQLLFEFPRPRRLWPWMRDETGIRIIPTCRDASCRSRSGRRREQIRLIALAFAECPDIPESLTGLDNSSQLHTEALRTRMGVEYRNGARMQVDP